MDEIAELVGVTPAEVSAPPPSTTCSTPKPVGTHVVSVCTNIACMLSGAAELLEHAESSLWDATRVAPPPTASFTLEEAECLADCGRAPCVQVNHRFVGAQTAESFDRLVDELRAGRPVAESPAPRHPDPGPTRRWACAPIRRQDRPAERAAMADGHRPNGRPPATKADGSGRWPSPKHRRSSPAGSSYDDSHTLERYLATGGYEGLRKALA